MNELAKFREGQKDIRREYTVDDAEIRSGAGDTLTLEGHASVVNRGYEISDHFGTFIETVKPGAFKRTLADGADVMLLVNHDGLPLARTKSGTLRLAEDKTGLHVIADLEPSDPDVQRIQPKMARGDLNEMSFAFRVREQKWNDDYTDREILSVNMHKGDVSVVNYGSNPATSAALRGLATMCDLAELDAAITALRAGEDADISLIERAAVALTDLLPKSQPEPAGDPTTLELFARSAARRYAA